MLIEVALLAGQLKAPVIVDVFSQPAGRSEADFGGGLGEDLSKLPRQLTSSVCVCVRACVCALRTARKLLKNVCDV